MVDDPALFHATVEGFLGEALGRGVQTGSSESER
jgi:hypothetical protein